MRTMPPAVGVVRPALGRSGRAVGRRTGRSAQSMRCSILPSGCVHRGGYRRCASAGAGAIQRVEQHPRVARMEADPPCIARCWATGGDHCEAETDLCPGNGDAHRRGPQAARIARPSPRSVMSMMRRKATRRSAAWPAIGCARCRASSPRRRCGTIRCSPCPRQNHGADQAWLMRREPVRELRPWRQQWRAEGREGLNGYLSVISLWPGITGMTRTGTDMAQHIERNVARDGRVC